MITMIYSFTQNQGIHNMTFWLKDEMIISSKPIETSLYENLISIIIVGTKSKSNSFHVFYKFYK
jgi:hypothetical protein